MCYAPLRDQRTRALRQRLVSSCARSGPPVFTRSRPPVFTQSVPPQGVFTQSVPPHEVFTQSVPPREVFTANAPSPTLLVVAARAAQAVSAGISGLTSSPAARVPGGAARAAAISA